jgi:hypothetical protein
MHIRNRSMHMPQSHRNHITVSSVETRIKVLNIVFWSSMVAMYAGAAAILMWLITAFTSLQLASWFDAFVVCVGSAAFPAMMLTLVTLDMLAWHDKAISRIRSPKD